MNMRIGGLASGMDVDSIVKQLMQVERIPRDRIYQKKQLLEWQRDAYREVNLALSKFRDAMAGLRLESTFIAYSVGSSDTNAVTAKASTKAVPGTYQVEIHQLARPASLTSKTALIADTDTNAKAKSTDRVLQSGESATSFTVTTSAGTATIQVTASDTYESLARKISEATGADGKSLGLKANFDNTTSRFFISTKEMGSDQKIEFGGDTQFIAEKILGLSSPSELNDDPSDHMSYDDVEDLIVITGQDAKLTYYDGTSSAGIVVDGLKSNEVTINGITMNLMATTPGKVSLTVKSDTDALFNKIKEFVDKYNELVDDLRSRLNEPKYRDYPPLTEEERKAISEKEAELWDQRAKSGLLRNDSILREALDSLRKAIYDPVKGISSNELNQISKIGITTGDWRNGGRLELDEEKLREALEKNPEEVMNLFTRSPEDSSDASQLGIAERVYAELNKSINALRDKAGTPGYTSGDQSVLGKTIYSLNDELADWEVRLKYIEDRYWKQFAAMETALDKLNQQSLWLQQNLLQMSGY
mgnify:CR=1 FL=1|jgi:flagellar hook-associated protein 2